MKQRLYLAAGLSMLILLGLSLPGATAGGTVRFSAAGDTVPRRTALR